MSENALLSPADSTALAEARRLNARPTVPNMPSIKLKSSEKKVLDSDGKPLTRGNYFLESYENEEKVVRDIGQNPIVTILHRCYTYSYYDNDAGQLVAWTTDIDDFASGEDVVLFSKKGGKAGIEFSGPYKDFKGYKEERYSVESKNGRKKSLLTFQNCLYVLFEGKVCRLFVKNTGTVGLAAGTNIPDFDNVQPLSLEDFVSTTRGVEMEAALLEFTCQLGGRFIEDLDQPFYIMTFKNVGPNEKLPETVPVFRKLSFDRAMMRQWDIDRMGGMKEEASAPDAEIFGEDTPAFIDA